MKGKSWEYLAGIMDGEGCFSIYFSLRTRKSGIPRKHYGIGISCYQQDVRLMKWLVHHFGGQYYSHPMKGERNPGYSWHAPTGKNAENFLLALIPYLLLKQEQAKLCLEYVRLGRSKDPEKRRILAETCSALNKKAPTTNTQGPSIPMVKIESELYGDIQSVPVVIQ